MTLPALIMAGGKGKRMNLQIEKPLLPLLGKPLIEWVIDAVKNTREVADFYIVTSPSTSNTEKKCLRENLKIIRTDGRGYHIDLKQAILAGGFGGPVLILPSDAPALTGQALDRVVMAHEKEGKNALAVFVPIEKREEMGLSVSSTDEFQGKPYAVSGINIINAREIVGEKKIETSAIVTEDVEFMLNINTLEDLDIAEKIMKKKMSEK